MRVSVVPIGNSRGIRIPKPLLEECGITDAVELRRVGKRLVLTPHRAQPRAGWAEAAARMHEAGDDALLIPDVFPDDPEAAW